jgi:hypothetical protein
MVDEGGRSGFSFNWSCLFKIFMLSAAQIRTPRIDGRCLRKEVPFKVMAVEVELKTNQEEELKWRVFQ